MADSVDNQENTVMTYNIERPFVSGLGGFDIQVLQDIYGTADAFADWKVTVDNNDMVTIKASRSSDTIIATDNGTLIFAGKGRDEVNSRQGDDVVPAARDDDTVTGGLGEDHLFGNQSDDLLIGDRTTSESSGNADSNDTLSSGDGDDRMTGGTGADVFLFLNPDAFETNLITDFTSGEDIIDVSALGFSRLNQFNQTVSGNTTTLSHGNWFELDLNGFTGTLTDSDFNFA